MSASAKEDDAMRKASTWIVVLVAIALPSSGLAGGGVTPSAVDVQHCQEQASKHSGQPSASPRSQPEAAQPGSDSRQQAQAPGLAPPPQVTPGPTQDREATPRASQTYQAVYRECLRNRGF
jgi:hypothetical protein